MTESDLRLETLKLAKEFGAGSPSEAVEQAELLMAFVAGRATAQSPQSPAGIPSTASADTPDQRA